MPNDHQNKTSEICVDFVDNQAWEMQQKAVGHRAPSNSQAWSGNSHFGIQEKDNHDRRHTALLRMAISAKSSPMNLEDLQMPGIIST